MDACVNSCMHFSVSNSFEDFSNVIESLQSLFGQDQCILRARVQLIPIQLNSLSAQLLPRELNRRLSITQPAIQPILVSQHTCKGPH